MIVGQEIGLVELTYISLFGMAVATAAILLLMAFVVGLSKVLSGPPFAGRIPGAAVAGAIAAGPVRAAGNRDGEIGKEELACIWAALSAHTGMSEKGFRIVSITNGR
ncbi:MAG: hypothetical protein FWD94_05150 [Treponema sp.]|nr:hypothetical protein [Treponema sp.]